MDPVTIGLLLAGGGALLRGIGGRREANATNRTNRAEDLRLEAEQRRRAEARASLMRGILNASGFGGTMTDEQMQAMFTGTRRRGQTTVPSILSGIGGAAGNVGQSLIMGGNDTNTPRPGSNVSSSAFWDFLNAIGGNATAVQPAVESSLYGV